MKKGMKHYISYLLILVSLMAIGMPVWGKTATYRAVENRSEIEVNGQWSDVYGYTINGSNYFRLRDLAIMFRDTPGEFDIVVDPATNKIELKKGISYSPSEYLIGGNVPSVSYKVKATPISLKIDGKMITLEAYVINQTTYFKLRDLGKYIPFDITVDKVSQRISLTTQPIPYTKTIPNKYFKTISLTNLGYGNWSGAKRAYLFDNEDGTVSYAVPDPARKQIVIETFNEAFQSVEHIAIPYELPIFGALHKKDNFYYAIFGQNNESESKTAEVYRIVKYTNEGKKINQISITGEESWTSEPFDAGCARMDIKDDNLIIHASRERFKSEDGLNHQSNITFSVEPQTMTLKSVSSPFPMNHVSHSFNQFVKFDGDIPVFVDHGDAYPRSVCLTKGYRPIDLFPITGKTGENYTGVQVGGFEISSESYLVVGTSIDQENPDKNRNKKNVFLCTLSKGDTAKPTIQWLTSYSAESNLTVSATPQLVKVNDTRFVAMWKEENSEGALKDLKYVVLDEEGRKVGAVQSLHYSHLSECDPIVKNDTLIWLSNNEKNITVYQVPLNLN